MDSYVRTALGLAENKHEIKDNAPSDNVGRKADGDKPRISLVPSEAIIAAARAMTFGAKKYAADNFKNGLSHRRLLDAAFRHLLAYSAHEDVDKESLLSHLDHAMASVAMLIWMKEHRPELDDRYKPNTNLNKGENK